MAGIFYKYFQVLAKLLCGVLTKPSQRGRGTAACGGG